MFLAHSYTQTSTRVTSLHVHLLTSSIVSTLPLVNCTTLYFKYNALYQYILYAIDLGSAHLPMWQIDIVVCASNYT